MRVGAVWAGARNARACGMIYDRKWARAEWNFGGCFSRRVKSAAEAGAWAKGAVNQ